MTKRRPLLLVLLSLLLLTLSLGHACAEPNMTPIRPQEKPVLMLPIQQLGQQLQSLVIGTSAPASDEDAGGEPAPTFGTKALNLLISAGDLLRTQSELFVTNFSALPQLSTWFALQRNDPHLHDRWIAIGNDVLNIVGISFLGALVLQLLLLPVRSTLLQRRPTSFRGRSATLFALFMLRSLPILVFIGSSLTLLDENEAHKLPRFIILNIVYALSLSRIIIALFRGVLAPNVSAFRIVPANDAQALYGYRWLRLFSLVIIYGYFIVDLARGLRVPDAAVVSFSNILGFFLVCMTMIVIVQKRAFVAIHLRGSLSAAQSDLTWWQGLRLWLARRWHILAISYLVIGYSIAALGVQNGFTLLLRGTILTLVIISSMRILFQATNRWGAKDTTASAALHHAVMRLLMRIVIWGAGIVAAAASWGADIPALFATPFGQRALGSLFSIGVTVVTVTVLYEIFNSSIERRLNQRDEEGKPLQASARVRTLLPMIRNTVFIAFTAIVCLVALSEVGVNIGPLLAGAGVFGVAVGFGSQTLVKDFLTGLFIIVENTIAVGDVIKVADHSGVVEAMSVRTLRLRDSDGAVHTLPYSEVTKVINMTKDFAFAVISVGVAYTTDLEKAMSVIRSVGDDLQKDPIFKRVILEPIEVFGVDALGDSSITLLSRLRVRPGKQWDVKRMFLLKMKQRFDQEGIEIPFPTVTNIQKVTPLS